MINRKRGRRETYKCVTNHRNKSFCAKHVVSDERISLCGISIRCCSSLGAILDEVKVKKRKLFKLGCFPNELS